MTPILGMATNVHKSISDIVSGMLLAIPEKIIELKRQHERPLHPLCGLKVARRERFSSQSHQTDDLDKICSERTLAYRRPDLEESLRDRSALICMVESV